MLCYSTTTCSSVKSLKNTRGSVGAIFGHYENKLILIHTNAVIITTNPIIKFFNSLIIGINQTIRSVAAATNTNVTAKDMYIPTILPENNKNGIEMTK